MTARPVLAPDALAGRRIWITGGGTGLGRAMAERSAALGAAVGLSARRAEPLEEGLGRERPGRGLDDRIQCLAMLDPEGIRREPRIRRQLGALERLVPAGLARRGARRLAARAEAATRGRFGASNARLAQLEGGSRISVRAPLAAHETPVVRPYLLVPDIKAAWEQAVAAGAEAAHPPLEIPGQGTFAIYILGGIQHGLWQD